jgi:hypothetical protein
MSMAALSEKARQFRRLIFAPPDAPTAPGPLN